MAHYRKAFSDEQKREIRGELKKKNSPTDARRLMILEAAEDGKRTISELAAIFQVSASSISHIITCFRRKGIQGIRSRKLGGNRRNLSREEEKEFLKRFLEQAAAGQVLEVSEIWRAYEELLGRRVSSCAVYGLLHRNGWRKVMPRGRHPKKASPEEIKGYKKNHGADSNTYGNILFSFSAHV